MNNNTHSGIKYQNLKSTRVATYLNTIVSRIYWRKIIYEYHGFG